MQLQTIELIKKIVFALVFVGLVLLIGHELELHLPDLEAWIRHLGAWVPLGFIFCFVLSAPVFVSIDALCFAAGLLFPIGAGELYIIFATYLAAALIFFLGRYLMRDRVFKFIAKDKRFAKLNTLVNDHGLKLMFLLRLTPLPFAMLSYAFSVTQVGFRPYLAATSGILIYNASLVYVGYSTKHLAGLINGVSPLAGVSYPMLAVGWVAALAVLIYVAIIAGKTVKKFGYKE